MGLERTIEIEELRGACRRCSGWEVERSLTGNRGMGQECGSVA